MNKKYILFLLLLLSVFFDLRGQQTAQKYFREIDYLLYLPDGYSENPTKKWPLMVFLHGSGNAGSNIDMVRRGGIPGLIDQGKQFPFVVISPQSQEQKWNITDLKHLLISEVNKYRIDTDKIYLTGLSMGGTGTWDFVVAYPEFFAAIIPICGNTSEKALENAFQLRHTPVWCFHGADDEVIKPSVSKNMIDSLRKYNPEAKLTIYPNIRHDSWTKTYNDDAVFEWMLQQTRYKNKVIELNKSILNEYVSYTYSIPDQGQIAYFTVENGGLRLWIGGQEGVLIKPSSKDTFFLDEDSRKYIIFERGPDGNISGLTLYEYNNKIFCKSITE